MDRREFLGRFFRYGTGIGTGLLLGGPLLLFSQEKQAVGNYDLVAVRGAEPAAMFAAGIGAFGGMGRFVGKGHVVVIKPNMSWSMKPEYAATTHPALIAAIVKHCFDAGARKVYVLDHTIDYWERAYSTTQIAEAARGADGTMVPANAKGYYQEVKVPGGRNLKNVMVHESVIEADVFINVPILKHHGSTLITSAMKNLMGVIWDRGYYHRNGLHQCIADFPLFRKPTLNVVDAYRVLKSGGPRGSSSMANVALERMQILSPDIVAADAAAAKTWGTEPERVRYIGLAEEHNLGRSNLSLLSIKRISMGS